MERFDETYAACVQQELREMKRSISANSPAKDLSKQARLEPQQSESSSDYRKSLNMPARPDLPEDLSKFQEARRLTFCCQNNS